MSDAEDKPICGWEDFDQSIYFKLFSCDGKLNLVMEWGKRPNRQRQEMLVSLEWASDIASHINQFVTKELSEQRHTVEARVEAALDNWEKRVTSNGSTKPIREDA